MLSWSSDMKKFNFFEEKKYKDLSNIQVIEEEDDDDNMKTKNENEIKNKQEIDTININNISISGPREIHAINGLLFINGKLIHDKDGKMIRENLIMKILDNKIIDLYRIFNGVYYRFELKIFKQKPYFIVVGGNFNEFMIDSKLELFMITSIKFYDATDFIFNKNEKYLPENLSNSKEEPYPKLLIKNIKLIKRLSDEKIMCEVEELSMEGYESFQNINSFAINSEFTHAAISLDKGDIILIYAYPNLLECNNNAIKMVFMPKINTRDKGHVTNLFFTQVNIFNTIKRILYASTSKIVYYYEWPTKSTFFSSEESNIKLKVLNPGGPGGYSGCIDFKQKYLLLGSANDDFICEFDNLEISKTWFFEGKKTHVFYFKDYILFGVVGERFSSLQVYDKKNSIFIYYKNIRKKIIGLCCDENNIYVFYEKSQNYKYILKLTEKTLKEKIQILFNRKLFDLAVTYAESYNLDKMTLSNLSRIFAEQEYKKENYNTSIQQFIKTIGFYDPSHVIQKFNTKTKIIYLIKYLEKLLDYLEIKNKINEEYENYTALLLNCYILENNIPLFKQYIQKKVINFSNKISKIIIDICLSINEIEFAFNYAKQNKMNIYYIEMLFKLNKKEEALNFIIDLGKEETNENKNQSQNKSILNHYEVGHINKNTMRNTNAVLCKEMQSIFNKFISYFLEEDNSEKIDSNSLSYRFFEIFMIFIYKNYEIIEEKDMNTLINNFLFYDKYFIMIFDKLVTYPIIFDKNIFHRRIELYLVESENNQNEKEVIYGKLIDLLSNQKYKNIYDFEYLMVLFKYYNFNLGIKFLSEQNITYDDLLLILFDKKEYIKINDLFNKNSPKEKLIWEKCLQFFLQELKDKNGLQNDLLIKSFQDYLSLLLQKSIIPPIEILDTINGINDEIPIDILRDFFLSVIEKENNDLVNNLVKSKEYEANIQEVDEDIYNMKERPIDVKLTKCDECNLVIDYPVLLFRCGHYYHILCLSYYFKDLKNAHCPRCFEFRKKVYTKSLESEKIYNILNNEEAFNKELNKYSNQIDFLNILYSKGIFKFNKTNKNEIYNK